MSAQSITATESACLFADDEPVFAGRPNGPAFGDDVWDFSAILMRPSQVDKRANFSRIAEPYRQLTREMLMVLAQPDHPVVIAAGITRRAKPASTATLVNVALTMSVISAWAIERGITSADRWQQSDADAMLIDFTSGDTHDGVARTPSTLRRYVSVLKHLREFGPVYSVPAFTFMPWGARTAASVVGYRRPEVNVTQPMPWEMWAPLVAAAAKVVRVFSGDIIGAWKAHQAIPKSARGGNAAKRLQEWIDLGNKIPLSTGVGLQSGAQRGQVCVNLLCRMVGINTVTLRRAHKSHDEAAIRIVEAAATNPATSALGGIFTPTVLVEHPDGTESTWISEIGSAEVRYLKCVLRGSCWVLIAALTGMRDSEIQGLRRGAVTERDGLPALRSIQFKGHDSDLGLDREWWAPAPVLDAVRTLERLSTNDRLFSFGDDDDCVYQHERDVALLVEFINGDPAQRYGRGQGLGLDPIDLSSRVPINQQTLRRSFAVLAAQHPGAELGLGIQLGHAALRMTSGYASDSSQQAVGLFNDARRAAARDQAAAIITGAAPVSGKQAGELAVFRAQVITDDTRADAIVESLADRYHVGTFNDCMFSAERAACGSDGPHLASQHCATSECANALFLTRHRDTVQAQIDRIDEWLDKGVGHPVVVERMRTERAKLVAVIRRLDSDEEGVE
jgi:hypothetical protein